MTIDDNDTKNISQFFRGDNNDLGLGSTSSPEKEPFKKPEVPVEYGGWNATVDLGPGSSKIPDDRRDTVNTIKSMPYSVFETTQGLMNFHENLRNNEENKEDLSTASFSWQRYVF